MQPEAARRHVGGKGGLQNVLWLVHSWLKCHLIFTFAHQIFGGLWLASFRQATHRPSTTFNRKGSFLYKFCEDSLEIFFLLIAWWDSQCIAYFVEGALLRVDNFFSTCFEKSPLPSWTFAYEESCCLSSGLSLLWYSSCFQCYLKHGESEFKL